MPTEQTAVQDRQRRVLEAAQEIGSMASATPRLSTPQTVICRQASNTGSIRPDSQPITSTCPAQKNAPASTKPSPSARVRPSVMVSRYRPITASPRRPKYSAGWSARTNPVTAR